MNWEGVGWERAPWGGERDVSERGLLMEHVKCSTQATTHNTLGAIVLCPGRMCPNEPT